MAASEKTLIYREDTDSFKNFLSKRDMRLIAAQEESNYVDLNELMELKLDDTKTVKVTFGDWKTNTLHRPSNSHNETHYLLEASALNVYL